MTEINDEINDGEQSAPTGQHVDVRRNAALSAGIGGFSAFLTIAFAARAFTGGTALDWLALVVLAVITGVHVAALADSRAPLLVADEHGVRLRQGSRWQGISWPEIDCLEHLPRRGLLTDGHLLVDGYDGQQLVVPLTLATRLAGADAQTLSDTLAALADGRADVVEVVPGLDDDTDRSRTSVPTLSDLYRDDDRPTAVGQRGIAAQVAAGLTGGAVAADAEIDAEIDPDDSDTGEELVVAEPVAREGLRGLAADEIDRLRDRMAAIRHARHDETDEMGDAEDTGEILLDEVDTESTDEFAAIDALSGPAPEPDRATVLAARVELDGSPRPPAEPFIPAVETTAVTTVLTDLAVHPVLDPVVGPDIAAARERLRLSIDQLADRTRIRPHVIEAIEVDDFGPCGGDFYARGHLRTLARVLGIDAGPLVATYDESYAHAPVDPRRVFASELATSSGGPIRSTRGGRNWSVLIAFVMAGILMWSVARLVLDGPATVGDTPAIINRNGTSQAATTQGEPIKVTLTAAGGGAQLVVRDGAGDVVFDGNLAFGQTSVLEVIGPVRIWSSDGSVTYALGKDRAKALGETGVEVSKTLVAR